MADTLERNMEEMAKGNEKIRLMNALQALSMAADLGVFTQQEKAMVLNAITTQSLSADVRSMIISREGFSHENGQIRRILDYFIGKGG